MITNFYVALLFGHLIGDFLFQNNWMAQNKNKKDGWFPCFVHCLTYTLSVIVFTKEVSFSWALIVFITHYPIDRWSLADKFSELYGSNSIKKFWNKKNKNNSHKENKQLILDGAFSAICYVVRDNTFHLLLMIAGHHILHILE